MADLRARADARRAALYVPAIPHPAVIEAYYKDYVGQYPSLLRAASGFTVETATQGLRLVLSGVFDAYPGLKIILRHLGYNPPGTKWTGTLPLCAEDKEKLLNGNAKRLLKINS